MQADRERIRWKSASRAERSCDYEKDRGAAPRAKGHPDT
jgi:hypothetical protein